MPGVTVDGLNVLAVYEAAGEAIARARRGEGPSLIECKTYRYYGHFEGDTTTYRTKEELAAYRDRDPILSLRRTLEARGIATAAELDAIDQREAGSIDEAWKFAEGMPYPAPEEALTDVYVSYP
jgi:pyruvate dehydrogenase E1 component alpha subunit